MTAEEMWNAFLAQCPEAADCAYEAWSYGAVPDELADLTRRGIKTATASAYPLYELEGESLPEADEYSVILWADDTAACVIRTEQVYVVPYREVSEEQAFREGEGDRTLSYWRKVHEPFFRDELARAGLVFTEDMGVVCETFRTVFAI